MWPPRRKVCMLHAMNASETSATLEELADALNNLRRIWDRPGMKRRFLSALREPVELGVLRTLRAVEQAEHDEACVGDVAATLEVEASTASRLVEQSVSSGYVRRAASQRDRRRTRLELTPAGARLLKRASRVRRELLAEVTADWTENDVAALGELLERLNRDLLRLEADR